MRNPFRPVPVLFPVFILACLLVSFSGMKEKQYPFERWKPEELAKANTAKDFAGLSEEEKKVIFYTNLARINPKLFGITYARKYIDSAGLRGSYCSSLFNTLKKSDSLPVLFPDSILVKTASDHAQLSGKLSTTGHRGKKKRIKEANVKFTYWGENCSYGYDGAMDIVMQLLIDDNVPDLGHRLNILNKNFTHIGVAIRKHGKYKWNCVQNFGGNTSK